MAKLDRYTLGQQIFELFIKLLTLTTQAQYQTGQTKITSLRLMILELDTTKILIRLSRKLEILDERAYIRYEKELNDVGKMLGGWIRNLENKQA